MNPTLRVALRAALVGTYAGLGLIVKDYPGLSVGDLLNAAYVAYGGALTYVGIGVFTDLEPTVGVKPRG